MSTSRPPCPPCGLRRNLGWPRKETVERGWVSCLPQGRQPVALCGHLSLLQVRLPQKSLPRVQFEVEFCCCCTSDPRPASKPSEVHCTRTLDPRSLRFDSQTSPQRWWFCSPYQPSHLPDGSSRVSSALQGSLLGLQPILII